MSDICIHPIPLVRLVGRGEMTKFTHLTHFGKDVEFGYYAWYLEDAGQKILIDAGGTAEMALGFGRPPETVTHIQTLTEGLAKYGVAPADIGIVILTHLHLDHIAYIRDYSHARIIVQQDELQFAQAPHPTDRFYDVRPLDGLNLEVIKGDRQITGRVRVLFTPGHSAGNQSVVVETQAGNVVITGCCIKANFEVDKTRRNALPVIPPGIHIDVRDAYDSMIKVKALADIIISNHDISYIDGEAIPGRRDNPETVK